MVEDKGKIHEARFLSLILSLHNSAWMALGKVASPLTGKIEKDLNAARGTIDLLETLRFKTRGNITPEEDKILASCLSTLQMNYVEESSPRESAAKEEAAKGKEPREEEQGGERPAEGNRE